MGHRYSFHFRIFENKGGKKIFFRKKAKKKKSFWIFFLDDFLIGNFHCMAPPQLVNVFERGNCLSLGGGREFAVSLYHSVVSRSVVKKKFG